MKSTDKVTLDDCDVMAILYRARLKYNEHKTDITLGILESLYFNNCNVDFDFLFNEYIKDEPGLITGEDLYRFVKYEFPNAVK